MSVCFVRSMRFLVGRCSLHRCLALYCCCDLRDGGVLCDGFMLEDRVFMYDLVDFLVMHVCVVSVTDEDQQIADFLEWCGPHCLLLL